jgi:hypothetical protein
VLHESRAQLGKLNSAGIAGHRDAPVLASTLSLIIPGHLIFGTDRALWLDIARRTFQSGDYCEKEPVYEINGAPGSSSQVH